MIYNICTYGNPVLREKSVEVEEVTDVIRTLLSDMIQTMRLENGVGLAAQQVGHRESVCVVDVPPSCDEDANGEQENPDVPMPMILLNPTIVDRVEKTVAREEGCLSFPGIYANVARSIEISLVFMDLDGQSQQVRLKGFVARAVQHELDHLNGVVFVDRISHVKKIALSGKLKRLSRATKEALQTAE